MLRWCDDRLEDSDPDELERNRTSVRIFLSVCLGSVAISTSTSRRTSSGPPAWFITAVIFVAIVVNAAFLALLLCRRKLTQRTRGLWGLLMVMCGVLGDVSTRGQADGWTGLILVTDACLLMGVSHRVFSACLAVSILHLAVRASDDIADWGFFSSVPGAERYDLACRLEGSATVVSVFVLRVLVYLTSCLVTRNFLASVMRERQAVRAAVVVGERVATLLARYETEQAERIVNGAEGGRLPQGMRDAYLLLLANLHSYKPYLPQSMFEADVTDNWMSDEGSTASDDGFGYSPGSSLCHVPVLPDLQSGVDAPSGESVCIVFTDVKGSTALWEHDREAMSAALHLHNTTIRQVLAEFCGYEVKTVGDSFMTAFSSAQDGLHFALRAQEALLNQVWPDGLPPATFDPPEMWKGLLIRCGVHCGQAELQRVALTGRYDYFGPTVNTAARVEPQAVPGTVAATDAVLKAVGEDGLRQMDNPLVLPLGDVLLRGMTAPTTLSVLLPRRLEARRGCVDSQLSQRQQKRRQSQSGSACASHSSRDSPSRLRESTSTADDCASISRGSSVGHARPGRRAHGLRANRATILHTAFRLFWPGGAHDSHSRLQTLVVALCNSAQNAGGTVGFVGGHGAVLAFNVARPCAEHELSAARASAEFYGVVPRLYVREQQRGSLVSKRASRKRSTQAFASRLPVGVGIATMQAWHGDVGTAKQRFVIPFGPCCETAAKLAQNAGDAGVFCLAVEKVPGTGVYDSPPLLNASRPVEWFAVQGSDVPIVVHEVSPLALETGAVPDGPGFGSVEFRKLFRMAGSGDTAAISRLRDIVGENLSTKEGETSSGGGTVILRRALGRQAGTLLDTYSTEESQGTVAVSAALLQSSRRDDLSTPFATHIEGMHPVDKSLV